MSIFLPQINSKKFSTEKKSIIHDQEIKGIKKSITSKHSSRMNQELFFATKTGETEISEKKSFPTSTSIKYEILSDEEIKKNENEKEKKPQKKITLGKINQEIKYLQNIFEGEIFNDKNKKEKNSLLNFNKKKIEKKSNEVYYKMIDYSNKKKEEKERKKINKKNINKLKLNYEIKTYGTVLIAKRIVK